MMKKIIDKLKCLVLGHKWRIFYVYGIMAHAKCDRCDATDDGFIDKYIKL
jgi:hypothetical protein